MRRRRPRVVTDRPTSHFSEAAWAFVADGCAERMQLLDSMTPAQRLLVNEYGFATVLHGLKFFGSNDAELACFCRLHRQQLQAAALVTKLV